MNSIIPSPFRIPPIHPIITSKQILKTALETPAWSCTTSTLEGATFAARRGAKAEDNGQRTGCEDRPRALKPGKFAANTSEKSQLWCVLMCHVHVYTISLCINMLKYDYILYMYNKWYIMCAYILYIYVYCASRMICLNIQPKVTTYLLFLHIRTISN